MKNLISSSCGWCGKPVKTGKGYLWVGIILVGLHQGECYEKYCRKIKEAHEKIQNERKSSKKKGMIDE